MHLIVGIELVANECQNLREIISGAASLGSDVRCSTHDCCSCFACLGCCRQCPRDRIITLVLSVFTLQSHLAPLCGWGCVLRNSLPLQHLVLILPEVVNVFKHLIQQKKDHIRSQGTVFMYLRPQ